MDFLIGLTLVSRALGYLLPVPCVFLAWRELARVKRVPPSKSWRRIASYIGILLLSFGLGLWFYAIVREARFHDYSYIVRSAVVGRWGSLGMLVVCIFAEPKLRRYLLFGTVGLFLFFAFSIGEIAI